MQHSRLKPPPDYPGNAFFREAFFRENFFKNRHLFYLKLYKINILLFFTMYFMMSYGNECQCVNPYPDPFPLRSDDSPNLIIPLGSYMRHIGLFEINADADRNTMFHHQREGISLDCWRDGHDIDVVDEWHQCCMCNTSIDRERINAAKFLTSTLIPAGSYLNSCIGLLKTKERDLDGAMRDYLYASCLRSSSKLSYIRDNSDDGAIIYNRFDITDCDEDRIENISGRLECREEPQARRKIVYGSYLFQGCNAALTTYIESEDRLYTCCEHSKCILSIALIDSGLFLENIQDCINNGMDITYTNYMLQCSQGSTSARIHTASKYIPAGNYVLTCTHIAYFPCAGVNGKGLLVARCLKNEPRLWFGWRGAFPVSVYMENKDNCISELGYVRNNNTGLICLSDVEFDPENQQRGEFINSLQCPE